MFRILGAAIELDIPRTCRVCHHGGSPSSLLVCSACGVKVFHKDCWSRWSDHRPNAPTKYETCEKIEFNEFVWIHWLLNSRIGARKQDRLHMHDIWTTWFGVPHYQSAARLDIYPRLQNLLSKSEATRPILSRQYPSLISFFGDTGGGKSSLIQALIRNAAPNNKDFEFPVPGNPANMHRSTSGDVHLYGDPTTLHMETPILYAG